MELTPYHAKYFAHDLTRRAASGRDRQELLGLPVELVRVDEDAVSLVQRYIERSVLGNRFLNDMLHIALATMARLTCW